MIESTLVSVETLSSINREAIYKYTLASVGNGAESDEIRLSAPEGGKLLGVRVSCNSANYNLSIRSRLLESGETVESGELMELFNGDVNKSRRFTDINEYYRNEDVSGAGYLYAVIDNADVATGLITLELVIISMPVTDGLYPWE